MRQYTALLSPQVLLLNVPINICKHPGVSTVPFMLCWMGWPLFHFDQQNLVRKPDFLWGMSQKQCQVFLMDLVFPFNNRHQTTCKNITTITKDFLKNKYSLQICEGRKAVAPELQVGQWESFHHWSRKRVTWGKIASSAASHPTQGSPTALTLNSECVYQSPDTRPWAGRGLHFFLAQFSHLKIGDDNITVRIQRDNTYNTLSIVHAYRRISIQ